MAKRLDGTPDEMRREAVRCSLKALRWLNKAADFERKAKAIEKKRDKYEKQQWPEEFCEACRKGKEKCFLHRKEGVDAI